MSVGFTFRFRFPTWAAVVKGLLGEESVAWKCDVMQRFPAAAPTPPLSIVNYLTQAYGKESAAFKILK